MAKNIRVFYNNLVQKNSTYGSAVFRPRERKVHHMQTALTASSGKSAKSIGSRFRQALSRYKFLYLMLLPGLAFFLVFSYIPMYGITIAFREFSYRNPFGGDWVGLKYFKEMMQDTQFWVSFKNTLQISLGRLIFEFPAPIILALLLNEMRGARLKRVYQTVFTFPHFLSWVVGAGIVVNLISESGAMNQIFSAMGLPKMSILTSPSAFRPMLYISNLWKEAGWSAIIYLAAITSINPELYEAAYVDGAGRFQRMLHITLPSIRGTIGVLLILAIASIANAGFDQIFNLYNALVYDVADILDTYIYRRTFVSGLSFSSSAAQGIFKSVINLILLVTANTLTKKISGQGIY